MRICLFFFQSLFFFPDDAVDQRKLGLKFLLFKQQFKASIEQFYDFFFQSVQLQPVHSIQNEVIKGLSNYYYTFVDVMEFRVSTNPQKFVVCQM